MDWKVNIDFTGPPYCILYFNNYNIMIIIIIGSPTRLLGLGSFFSFLLLNTICRTLCLGDQSAVTQLPTLRKTQREYTHIYIHALSGIRAHDRSIRSAEGSPCFTLRWNCVRQKKMCLSKICRVTEDCCTYDSLCKLFVRSLLC
jgi:hypothetical protein